MSIKDEMGELDLQLYLAGAMSFSQRARLSLVLLVSGDLRRRLREVKAANVQFAQNEMVRLEAKLFPATPRVFTVTHINPPFGILGWVGALALLTLCAIPILYPNSNQILPEEAYTAKGRGLGVNLFVKGDTSYRVENQAARILPSDTLQVVPIGSEAQYLILLGWDERQGMVTLFPESGAYSKKVSTREPPPALLLQDIADNRLICITATSPFRVQDAMRLLGRQPFNPIVRAPITRLITGRYVQIFAITKKASRI
jgi:hypothetical protein